jgi:hypothetical protein
MTPESMAALVARWTRAYTRHLPASVADRRREEIASDVHDHIASARAQGIRDGRIARSIASRTLRGLVADAAWRRHQIAVLDPAGKRTRTSLTRSAIRIAVGVLVVLAIPLIAMAFRSDVVWSPADFVLAGVLLTVIGVTLELAIRRSGKLTTSAGIAVLGVGAAIAGGSDDAPGLVLMGLLLIAGAGAMAVRMTRGSR